jgi:hypothetical protein
MTQTAVFDLASARHGLTVQGTAVTEPLRLEGPDYP